MVSWSQSATLSKGAWQPKKSTLCSEGVLLGLDPFPLGCYIILLVYGLFLASVCQYWGVLMAIAASWQGSACVWETFLSVLLLPSAQLTC